MIIFLGVSGAGKSVQGNILAKKINLPWISTGKILRRIADAEHQAKIIKGYLLNDELIINLVSNEIANTPKRDCILDGFPRTKMQAEWLLEQAAINKLKLDAVIVLMASEETVLKRINDRGRQDDTEDVIRRRFNNYRKYTMPLIDQFKEAGIKIIKINGEGSIQEVTELINKALNR